MPKRLTQEQRRAVTAALFRQEPYPDIAAAHGISERRLRGIASCLRTWGTTHPPRTKPMGRPKAITDESQQGLRDFVNARPLASLEEMQVHIQNTFNIKCSYQSVSRRLKDMGYKRTIVQRGNRSLERDNIPELSDTDKLRLQGDPAAAELLGKTKVIYAWLLSPSKSGSKRSKLASHTKTGFTQENNNASNGQPSEDLSDDGRNEAESLDGLFYGDNSVSDSMPTPAVP
ncbi:conserved hypothetical protein [Histoplasma capsulatum H143]|uniref:Insertion element IS150 protein InsJ-like helix-turn-helix domain-containing protein n=1 Tax=Ajellomyces capsulatus (strain H143) TaxID=544712 RepID=C6HL99_AJECH|nr:conserved hypothetical protein [Histoplasma capsulatum H143]